MSGILKYFAAKDKGHSDSDHGDDDVAKSPSTSPSKTLIKLSSRGAIGTKRTLSKTCYEKTKRVRMYLPKWSDEYACRV
jgi:hypothetical protein